METGDEPPYLHLYTAQNAITILEQKSSTHRNIQYTVLKFELNNIKKYNIQLPLLDYMRLLKHLETDLSAEAPSDVIYQTLLSLLSCIVSPNESMPVGVHRKILDSIWTRIKKHYDNTSENVNSVSATATAASTTNRLWLRIVSECLPGDLYFYLVEMHPESFAGVFRTCMSGSGDEQSKCLMMTIYQRLYLPDMLSLTGVAALIDATLGPLLGRVVPLMFEDSGTGTSMNNATSSTRLAALRLLQALLPAFPKSEYRSAPEWSAVKQALTNKYYTILLNQVTADDNSWHEIWTVCVRLLAPEIQRSAHIMNKLLGVIETGLRSQTQKANTWSCWKVLIGIYGESSDGIATTKYIKLLSCPFKRQVRYTTVIGNTATAGAAGNSTTDRMFDAWTHLFRNIRPGAFDEHCALLVRPFLEFGFGLPADLMKQQHNNNQNGGGPSTGGGTNSELLYRRIVYEFIELLGHDCCSSPSHHRRVSSGNDVDDGIARSVNDDEDGGVETKSGSVAAAGGTLFDRLKSHEGGGETETGDAGSAGTDAKITSTTVAMAATTCGLKNSRCGPSKCMRNPVDDLQDSSNGRRTGERVNKQQVVSERCLLARERVFRQHWKELVQCVGELSRNITRLPPMDHDWTRIVHCVWGRVLGLMRLHFSKVTVDGSESEQLKECHEEILRITELLVDMSRNNSQLAPVCLRSVMTRTVDYFTTCDGGATDDCTQQYRVRLLELMCHPAMVNAATNSNNDNSSTISSVAYKDIVVKLIRSGRDANTFGSKILHSLKLLQNSRQQQTYDVLCECLIVLIDRDNNGKRKNDSAGIIAYDRIAGQCLMFPFENPALVKFSERTAGNHDRLFKKLIALSLENDGGGNGEMMKSNRVQFLVDVCAKIQANNRQISEVLSRSLSAKDNSGSEKCFARCLMKTAVNVLESLSLLRNIEPEKLTIILQTVDLLMRHPLKYPKSPELRDGAVALMANFGDLLKGEDTRLHPNVLVRVRNELDAVFEAALACCSSCDKGFDDLNKRISKQIEGLALYIVERVRLSETPAIDMPAACKTYQRLAANCKRFAVSAELKTRLESWERDSDESILTPHGTPSSTNNRSLLEKHNNAPYNNKTTTTATAVDSNNPPTTVITPKTGRFNLLTGNNKSSVVDKQSNTTPQNRKCTDGGTAATPKSRRNLDQDFVVIPKTPVQKPKYTEKQKEKMQERRADIPPLYNELSQQSHSQDQSITMQQQPDADDSTSNTSKTIFNSQRLHEPTTVALDQVSILELSTHSDTACCDTDVAVAMKSAEKNSESSCKTVSDLAGNVVDNKSSVCSKSGKRLDFTELKDRITDLLKTQTTAQCSDDDEAKIENDNSSKQCDNDVKKKSSSLSLLPEKTKEVKTIRMSRKFNNTASGGGNNKREAASVIPQQQLTAAKDSNNDSETESVVSDASETAAAAGTMKNKKKLANELKRISMDLKGSEEFTKLSNRRSLREPKRFVLRRTSKGAKAGNNNSTNTATTAAAVLSKRKRKNSENTNKTKTTESDAKKNIGKVADKDNQKRTSTSSDNIEDDSLEEQQQHQQQRKKPLIEIDLDNLDNKLVTTTEVAKSSPLSSSAVQQSYTTGKISADNAENIGAWLSKATNNAVTMTPIGQKFKNLDSSTPKAVMKEVTRNDYEDNIPPADDGTKVISIAESAIDGGSSNSTNKCDKNNSPDIAESVDMVVCSQDASQSLFLKGSRSNSPNRSASATMIMRSGNNKKSIDTMDCDDDDCDEIITRTTATTISVPVIVLQDISPKLNRTNNGTATAKTADAIVDTFTPDKCATMNDVDDVDVDDDVANAAAAGGTLNASKIVSSPDQLDLPERATELLNNTLDISPIRSNDDNDVDDGPAIETIPLKDLMPSSNAAIVPNSESAASTMSSPLNSRHSNDGANNNKRTNKNLSTKSRSAQMLGLCCNKDIITEVISDQSVLRSPVALTKNRDLSRDLRCLSPVASNASALNGMTTGSSANGGRSAKLLRLSDMDLLTFKKEVPSPLASPSVGILKRGVKRKLTDDLVDAELLPPSKQSKRVSFNDPIFTTKYLLKETTRTAVLDTTNDDNTSLSVSSKPCVRKQLIEDEKTLGEIINGGGGGGGGGRATVLMSGGAKNVDTDNMEDYCTPIPEDDDDMDTVESDTDERSVKEDVEKAKEAVATGADLKVNTVPDSEDIMNIEHRIRLEQQQSDKTALDEATQEANTETIKDIMENLQETQTQTQITILETEFDRYQDRIKEIISLDEDEEICGLKKELPPRQQPSAVAKPTTSSVSGGHSFSSSSSSSAEPICPELVTCLDPIGDLIDAICLKSKPEKVRRFKNNLCTVSDVASLTLGQLKDAPLKSPKHYHLRRVLTRYLKRAGDGFVSSRSRGPGGRLLRTRIDEYEDEDQDTEQEEDAVVAGSEEENNSGGVGGGGDILTCDESEVMSAQHGGDGAAVIDDNQQQQQHGRRARRHGNENNLMKDDLISLDDNDKSTGKVQRLDKDDDDTNVKIIDLSREDDGAISFSRLDEIDVSKDFNEATYKRFLQRVFRERPTESFFAMQSVIGDALLNKR